MITKNQLVYHRGRHGADIGVKENSWEALERAIDEGAEWLEFDVWEDMKIAHDPGADERTLRLNEALAIIEGRCGVNIEIKDPQMSAAVIDTIKGNDVYTKGWGGDNFLLSTFHHPTAISLKRKLPTVRVGVVMDAVPDLRYVKLLRSAGIDNLHLEQVNILVDARAGYKLREMAQHLGMEIWVWTVNDRARAEFILNEYGAEKVFTDRPDILLGA